MEFFMKKSKIYYLLVIFTTLFFLFTIIAFSQFSQGFETGFKIGQELKEKKFKEEQQKKLEYEKIKIQESINVFINFVKQYGIDGVYSEGEKLELNNAFLSFAPEVQVILKDINDAIQLM